MKDVRTILYNLSAEQGWDGAMMLELCLNYIEAQESNEAFEDFLMQQADWENTVLTCTHERGDRCHALA